MEHSFDYKADKAYIIILHQAGKGEHHEREAHKRIRNSNPEVHTLDHRVLPL
jgi:hypothetical protein